jgi:hypothetical protein
VVYFRSFLIFGVQIEVVMFVGKSLNGAMSLLRGIIAVLL